MNIIFKNNCRYAALISIESEKTIRIKPYDTVNISYEDKQELNFIVKQEAVSYKKNSKYILMIETRYKFGNVDNNELFTISREKTCVSGRIFYDKLFMKSENAICFAEYNNVLGAKEVRDMFNKSQIKYYLFLSPIEHLTGWVIIFAVLGIFVVHKTSMIFSIIYFVSCYLLVLIMDCIMRQIDNTIFEKSFEHMDEKTEFLYYLENKTVDEYFSDPNRKPFMGKVEIN